MENKVIKNKAGRKTKKIEDKVIPVTFYVKGSILFKYSNSGDILEDRAKLGKIITDNFSKIEKLLPM